MLKPEVQNLTIETPRLILRQPRLEDAEKMHQAKLETWDELHRWMSWSSLAEKEFEATKENVKKNLKRSENGDLIFWGFRKDTGQFVISTGLHHVAGELNSLSIGYWAAKSQQGNGFATEASAALIRLAFEFFGTAEMQIDHFEGNERSQNVIKKLGFAPSDKLKKTYLQHSTGIQIHAPFYTLKSLSAVPQVDYKIV